MSLSFLVAPPVIPRNRASVAVRDGKPVPLKQARNRTTEENSDYYRRNGRRIRAKVAAWQKSPAGKASRRRYYLRNRAAEIAKRKQWYLANREHVLAMARARYHAKKAESARIDDEKPE